MGVCASAPDFRVRYGAGAFKRVLLSRGASPADIKEAVAGAVGVAVGTFFVRSAASGAVAPLHAGLVGDWEVELLPAMAQAQAPTGVAAAGRPDDLLLAAVERLGERIEATGQQTVEMLRQVQAAIAGVRQRLSPPREGGVGRIFAANGSLPLPSRVWARGAPQWRRAGSLSMRRRLRAAVAAAAAVAVAAAEAAVEKEKA